MLIPNFSSCIKELLVLHEIFGRLGYPSEQLFVLLFTNAVQFAVRAENTPEFLVTVEMAPPNKSIDISAVAAEWSHAIAWWRTLGALPSDERHALKWQLLDQTQAWRIRTQLVIRHMRSGLSVPQPPPIVLA